MCRSSGAGSSGGKSGARSSAGAQVLYQVAGV